MKEAKKPKLPPIQVIIYKLFCITKEKMLFTIANSELCKALLTVAQQPMQTSVQMVAVVRLEAQELFSGEAA